MTLTDMIIALKRNGFSYREIARHLGVSHETVRLWALRIYRPRNLDEVLHKVRLLLDDDGDRIINNYHSDTHNDAARDLMLFKVGVEHRNKKLRRLIPRLVYWADVLGISDHRPVMYTARDLIAIRKAYGVSDDAVVLGALLASVHACRPEMFRAVLHKVMDLPIRDEIRRSLKSYTAIIYDRIFSGELDA